MSHPVETDEGLSASAAFRSGTFGRLASRGSGSISHDCGAQSRMIAVMGDGLGPDPTRSGSFAYCWLLGWLRRPCLDLR